MRCCFGKEKHQNKTCEETSADCHIVYEQLALTLFLSLTHCLRDAPATCFNLCCLIAKLLLLLKILSSSEEHLPSLKMDQLSGNLNNCFLFFNNSFLDLKAMLTKFGSTIAMLKQKQGLKPQICPNASE